MINTWKYRNIFCPCGRKCYIPKQYFYWRFFKRNVFFYHCWRMYIMHMICIWNVSYFQGKSNHVWVWILIHNVIWKYYIVSEHSYKIDIFTISKHLHVGCTIDAVWSPIASSLLSHVWSTEIQNNFACAHSWQKAASLLTCPEITSRPVENLGIKHRGFAAVWSCLLCVFFFSIRTVLSFISMEYRMSSHLPLTETHSRSIRSRCATLITLAMSCNTENLHN